MNPARPRLAFTLVELLVAVSLILVVVAVATAGVMQMMKTTRRLQALQNMNEAAAMVQAKLGDEVAGMHHGSAVWLRTPVNATDNTLRDVELVFMAAQRNIHDYRTMRLMSNAGQFKEIGYCDLQWTRWFWNASSAVLLVSHNRPVRQTRIFANATRNYWQLPAPAGFTSATLAQFTQVPEERSLPFFSIFLSIPQPVRQTGGSTDPQPLLDLNTWNRPAAANFEASEMGDYTDLLRQSRPILRGCSDLRLELILEDGSTVTSGAAPGYFVDGRSEAGATARPSLVRLAFTLREGDTPFDRDASTTPGSDTRPSQSYSFSFPTMLPSTY